MAILKDLIVHGSSRFLNKIYANELEVSAFEAESAIIKKLTAKDSILGNATVVGLLDVQGQLHTNTWTNSNIATIDGCFYITPTLSSDSGNIVFSSVNVASLTGDFTAVNSLYIGDSSSGSTVQWTSGSKILLTGEVEVNGQWLPLGTLLGTLSANATTNSIGLKELKDNRHNDSSIIIDIRNAVSNTSLNYRNLKISLYQRKDGTDSKPLGIYMTAMGTNGKTFIDIYGGVNATTTAGSSGGFADPNLRIGNLSGLSAVEGITPIGWGIYTTNGYFKGVIVSSAGKIGGWSIGTSGIYNGITGVTTTGSTVGTFIGTGGISNYKNTSTYVNIQNGVITAKGVNLTGQINATAGNIGGATIEGGVLTVPAARVSGELTAATINGSKITANTITADQIAAGAIKTDELDANAVTSAKIKAGQVKATNIASSAVTADKLDATTINASNKLTVGALTTATQNNILNSNIQIGGTNLLKNTDATTIAKTITIASTSSSTYSEGWTASVARVEGENTYTVSFDAKADDDSTTAICHWYNPNTTQSSLSSDGHSGTGADGYVQVGLTTDWKRYWVTWTQSDTASTNKSLIVGRLSKPSSGTKTIYVRAIKMEVGNKATAWSPAPEEVDVRKYITDIDSNKGITIKPADTSGNNYLQINSSAINFYRNNEETLKIENSTIRVGKLGNNLRNVYITDGAVQIRNNTSVLAEYGSSIKLYQPTTTTVAVEISSTGATFTGNVKATSLSTGTKTAATTGKGTFINSDGAIYVGNGSTNNFTVTDTGTITATGANLLTATIGNATNKITIGTGTSGHSSVRYGMTTLADTTNNGFYIGTDGIALGKGAFKVTAAGVLNATGATISGSITATSLTLGTGVTIGYSSISNPPTIPTTVAQLTDSGSYLTTTVAANTYATQTAVNNAAGTASNYISATTNGIKIANANPATATYYQLQTSTGTSFYVNSKKRSEITANGFYIYDNNSSNNQIASFDATTPTNPVITLGKTNGKNVKINNDGVTINIGSTALASYGNIVKIGNLSKIHLDLNDTYLSLKQSDASSQLISFGLKNDSSTGLATLTKRGYMLEQTISSDGGDEDVLLFCLDLNGSPILERAVQILSAYQIINEEVDTDNPISPSVFTIKDGQIQILDVNSNLKNKRIQITFTTDDKIPFLELGDESQCYGANSIASGDFVTVYGQESFAIGEGITVFGDHSLAVGNEITITTPHSMAYGWENSVQGECSLVGGFNSKASGWASVALGEEAKATGPYSAALGYGVDSKGGGSLACGYYNNGNSAYVFTVGNGLGQDDRQNAFWVGSSGNCGVQNILYVGGVMRSGEASGTSAPMFWYETKTFSDLSISANSAATGKSIDITMTNHQPIGIVGIRILNATGGANSANCNVYIYTITNSGGKDYVTFSIKNFAATAAKVNVEFKVFYIARNALSSQLS